MTTIIAASDLYNPREYGRVAEGQAFTVRDSLARELVSQGKAHNYAGAVVQYETKIVTPEVKPITAQPFRDVPDSDKESPAVATRRASMRKVSDLPTQGTVGDIERGGCKGPNRATEAFPSTG